METAKYNTSNSQEFNQIIDLIHQLPEKERFRLTEIMVKEYPVDEIDPIFTYATEQLLAEDWLRPEEEEAWKDL